MLLGKVRCIIFKNMKVKLLYHTPNPELVVTAAAKLCYSAAGIEEISVKLTSEEINKFIKKIIQLGHYSVLEHICFTFGIEGISRACSHQLVRHRLASFSQQSQRYVKFKGELEYILPPTIKKNQALTKKFSELIKEIKNFYNAMLNSQIPAEDARYIFPNAATTKLVVTMNARELLHFFELRCCSRAQWEIRRLATAMLVQAKKVAPQIFTQAGPICLHRDCPEIKLCPKPWKRQVKG